MICGSFTWIRQALNKWYALVLLMLLFWSNELIFVYPLYHRVIVLNNFSSQQLYSSAEFGRRWQLIQEGVVPNRFYW